MKWVNPHPKPEHTIEIHSSTHNKYYWLCSCGLKGPSYHSSAFSAKLYGQIQHTDKIEQAGLYTPK